MGCLYKLTSPSGKSYIGISSKTMDARWHKHVEHAMGKRDAGALYNALRKYGPENFIREQLVECDDWETLCQMEIEAIQTHNTFSPSGYNITFGGEGTLGPISDEARVRVSIAQKKRFQRPEERERLFQCGEKGRQAHREKHKANRIDGRAPWEHQLYVKRTRQGSLEHREKLSIAVKSAMARPEIKEKLVACAKSRAASPEWRKKISIAKTGKKVGPCSEERKARISAARKREWQDPVIRERRLMALAKAREAIKKP